MGQSQRDAVDRVNDAVPAGKGHSDHPAIELASRSIRLASMLEDVLTAELAPWGLTKADYGVLITLRASGKPFELRPSELRARLLMTSGGVSGVLNRLEKTGYVERRPHPTDGRSFRVKLTPAGLSCADDAAKAWTVAQQDALRKVPDDVSRSAADALRRVLLALGDTGGTGTAR